MRYGRKPVKTGQPRFSTPYPRERLFERLDTARLRHAIALVSGPPGAGKTTLLASYINYRNLHCVWYQLNSGDDDAATFFHYFRQAAGKYLGHECPTPPEYDPAQATDLKRFARQYFRDCFARLRAPLVIFFDDYHELAEGSPTHDVVRVACEEAPECCHVVIATRECCPASLARIRFSDALMVIGPEDLALSLEETTGLAKSRGVVLRSSAAAALQTHCAGWAMGLVMLLERNGANELPAGDVSMHPGEEVFGYFAAEVFRNLDTEARDVLPRMALMPLMTAERVTNLTGSPRAYTVLLDLLRRNHFVSRHDTGSGHGYQFHPLFRSFLLNEASRRFGHDELLAQYNRAAELLIAEGDAEGGLTLLAQSRNWPRGVEVILATAPALCAQGRLATLARWLGWLPQDLVGTNPWLIYWNATSKAVSDPECSLELHQEAYRRFVSVQDLPGMALSWSGLIEVIFSIHRNLRPVDAWLVEFKERLEGRLGELAPDIAARVTLAVFIAMSFREPLHPRLPVWREQVHAILEVEKRASERARLRRHLLMHHILAGEHAEAELVLSMTHCDDSPPEDDCERSRTALDYINEATVAMHVGMAERGLRAVSEGLRAAEGSGNRLFDSELLQLGALIALNRGNLEQADSCLASFERLAEALPFVDRGLYYAVSAWRKLQKGESRLALQLFGRALAASEARGTPYYIALDNLGFGLLLHLCGKTAEGQKHLAAGREIGIVIRNPLIEYGWRLFSAQIALDLGQHRQAREHVECAMGIGRQHGYMHLCFFPRAVMARLCLEALEAGIETSYVRALIERNALAPNPAWPQAEAWPWPLRIYTLGRFSVVRHGETLRFTGKAQKKPLDLLKALIAFGGRGVSEARLADALWPGAEGDAAAQALATTLFRLRKLIGERTIHRQDSRLSLDPTLCWVDCWAFERLSNDGAADHAQRLEKLRRLHHGPFLNDADDAPWAEPMRQRLRTKLARLLRPA